MRVYVDWVKVACLNPGSESPASYRGSLARSKASPSEICGEQGGTGSGFSPNTMVFLCHLSIDSAYSY